MLGFGFQAWLLGLKPMGFGFRPPPVKPLQGAKKKLKAHVTPSFRKPQAVPLGFGPCARRCRAPWRLQTRSGRPVWALRRRPWSDQNATSHRGVSPKFEVLWVIYYGSFDDTT